MNKSMLAGIGIGVAAALGVAAVASLNVFERGPQYAQVVSATPIKETVKTPRQECRNVTVTHRRPVQDENRITGSVLGAVAGGVIGHQFGGGRGKDVATVVGALGGGYAGNQIQGSLQESDTYTTTQQRCKTVYDKSEKMLGYDVTYKIGDRSSSASPKFSAVSAMLLASASSAGRCGESIFSPLAYTSSPMRNTRRPPRRTSTSPCFSAS